MTSAAPGYNHHRQQHLNRAGPRNAQTGQAPASHYWNHTRSAPSNRTSISLDEARLRPHLRQVQPSAFTPGGIDTMPSSSLGQLTTKSESEFQFPMPQDLRGIPVVGPGVGGVQPGTNPETATIAKLSRAAAA